MFIRPCNRYVCFILRHLQKAKVQSNHLFEHDQFEIKYIWPTRNNSSRRMAGVGQGEADRDTAHRKYLIVGLGNYDIPRSRHSVGMQFVNKVAAVLDLQWKREAKTCMGYIAKCDISINTSLVLLKPKVPMNVNGSSVLKTARFHGIDVSNIYMVHDDIDKKMGKVTIKEKGSASGHNGVKSVVNCMRTDEIPRVRIGVDKPADKDQVVDYVLSDFSCDEQSIIDRMIIYGIGLLLEHMSKHGADTNLLNLRTEESQSQIRKSGA